MRDRSAFTLEEVCEVIGGLRADLVREMERALRNRRLEDGCFALGGKDALERLLDRLRVKAGGPLTGEGPVVVEVSTRKKAGL